jgi:RimJ/RimL family protein N-acetyltransferase
VKNSYAAGRHVYLRHPTSEEVEGRWHEWLSDEETTRWLVGHAWPNSLERQREFYEASTKRLDRLVLSVIDKESDKHIGVCNLSSINWVHRFCDVAIVIGEEDYRTGPYAVETMSILLGIAFLRLNLRIVKSSFAAGNEASASIHDVFRFKEVGRIEELFWARGYYVDNVLVTLSRRDWMARNAIAAPAHGEG